MSPVQKALKVNSIKADLKRTIREYYDKSSSELQNPEGKQVCVRRPPPRSRPKGSATRFIRRFDGLYIVTRHVHGLQDLLRLRHKFIQIIAVSDELSDDLTNYEDQLHNAETGNRSELPTQKNSVSDPDLAQLAFAFGQYLNGPPGAQAYASEACKVV